MKIEDKRRLMVEDQIHSRGIETEAVLKAFLKVERHLFVHEEIQHLAYNDSPLNIGKGQTISQPYIVALMLDLLEIKKSDNILEIGTGSGYQTALLAELAGEVYTVERIDVLLLKARDLLRKMGYKNINYLVGDGTRGWKEGEPMRSEFDKIVVAAAAPDIPTSLMEQLADGGIMVIPAGNRSWQDLIVIKKVGDEFITTNHGGCTFVPLIGQEGWSL
ncbi:protein-L-isoaspartate(D-aspartate) O-methyltransferase [Candidatus Cloacimonadota bacterium]